MNEVSTDVQRETCQKYARDRGWQVVDVFEDVGRSAFKANVRRPAFDALVDGIETGDVDTLIAYKLDRVARSVRDFANLAGTLDDHGAEFVSVTESFDSTTPMGRAMVSIASVFAELESAVKSERIGDALAHRRARGAPTNGPRPYGLKGDRQHLEPAEARLVRQAARRILAGGSLRAVVGEWNAKEIVTARGGAWSRRGLAYVLTNPTTAGLRDVDGVLVAGTMTPVLDRETWDAVRVILTDPARRTSGGENAQVHFLTGLVVCASCGTPMATKPNAAGWRYQCSPRKGFDACGTVSIDGTQTEAQVGAAIVYALDTPGTRAAMKRKRPRSDELAAIDDDLEALAADFGAGRLTYREWQAARTALETRRVDAENERTTGRDAATLARLSASADVAKAWDALDVAGQRAVLRTLVERVSIQAATAEITRTAAQARRDDDPDDLRPTVPADRIVIDWKA